MAAIRSISLPITTPNRFGTHQNRPHSSWGSTINQPVSSNGSDKQPKANKNQ